MRILITGGCGFLGAHLVEHFLKNTDADIVVLDKLTYASSGFDRLRDVRSNLRQEGGPLFADRVWMLGCDLAQPIPEGILRELGTIDYIIHAAAESHVDNSIVDPLPFLHSNVIGTHHLLMLAKTLGVRRTFLVSTDEVYGPAHRPGHGTFMSPAVQRFHDSAMDLIDVLTKAEGSPHSNIEAMLTSVAEYRTQMAHRGFSESAAFRPANPYAAAKAGGECLAMAYANTYRLPLTIVNTMNLIGERQHPEKFVPLVIRRVLAGKEVLIHADPTCTWSGTRFYLHCRTYADALGWLIDGCQDIRVIDGQSVCMQQDRPPLKLHVCGEREISNLDLASLIAGYVGKPLHYHLVDFHSSRPGHDLRYAMDDSLITSMGWKRPMNLEQSLEKTVRWYLDNPQWLHLGKEN